MSRAWGGAAEGKSPSSSPRAASPRSPTAGSDPEATGWGVTAMRSAMVNGLYSMRTQLSDMMPHSNGLESANGEIWLLGRRFSGPDQDGFPREAEEISWFSYRRGFNLMGGPSGELSYDTGWGCMHRCAQMLLHTLLRRHLALRAAQLDPNFRDVEHAPFSIHRLVAQSAREGKRAGEWLAHTEVARVLKRCVEGEATGLFRERPVQVEVPPWELGIDAGQFRAAAAQCPVLLLVTTMLGVAELNPVYIEHLKACLRVRQCVGIIGGRQRQAMYLVGYRGDTAIVLDPHRVQSAYLDDSSRGHCQEPRRSCFPFHSLSSNAVIGFFAENGEEAEQVLTAMAEINALSQGKYAIFSFARPRKGARTDVQALPGSNPGWNVVTRQE
eukprot:Hpha_TRINITY_DN1800_c0_g1::TRINITY_DN1800_c0_g1_i1::g.170721::m.170721/K08342/ATG4; cysteine protease ATG4